MDKALVNHVFNKKDYKNFILNIPFHIQPAVIDTNQWVKSQALFVVACNMLKLYVYLAGEM